MRTILLSLACVAAIAAVAPSPARADDKVARVGIVISVTVNTDYSVAESIGGQLAAALVKKLKVDAIGGSEVTRRLPPAGLPDECLTTPDCVADLGKRLDADQLLFLSVVRVGTDFQVDATWVEIATGKQAARPRVALTDPHKAIDPFVAEAERFLPDADIRTGVTTHETVVVHTEGERHRPIKPVVWVAAGASVALLATGVVLGLQAKSKYDNCNGVPEDGPWCSDSEIDAIDRRALYSDIAMGLGVGAAVTAVVLYFKTPVEITPVTPTVSPVPGGAVLSFDGTF